MEEFKNNIYNIYNLINNLNPTLKRWTTSHIKH